MTTRTTFGDTQSNPRKCSEPLSPTHTPFGKKTWRPVSAGFLEVKERSDNSPDAYWWMSYTRWTVWALR